MRHREKNLLHNKKYKQSTKNNTSYRTKQTNLKASKKYTEKKTSQFDFIYLAASIVVFFVCVGFVIVISAGIVPLVKGLAIMAGISYVILLLSHATVSIADKIYNIMTKYKNWRQRKNLKKSTVGSIKNKSLTKIKMANPKTSRYSQQKFFRWMEKKKSEPFPQDSALQQTPTGTLFDENLHIASDTLQPIECAIETTIEKTEPDNTVAGHALHTDTGEFSAPIDADLSPIPNEMHIVLSSDPDQYLLSAGDILVRTGRGAIGLIQRYLRIGFFRAERIMNQLQECGVVGEEKGTAPRTVLMTKEQYEFFSQNFDSIVEVSYQQERSEPIDPIVERVQMYNNKFDYMEGHDFEYFCAELLKKNGFYDVSVTVASRDQGIDIIAYKDGVKYGVQCKCYSSDIGNRAVQEAFSGAKFYDCHVPVVLTNRYFTNSAIELSQKTNVLLWDRDYLEKMVNTTSGETTSSDDINEQEE